MRKERHAVKEKKNRPGKRAAKAQRHRAAPGRRNRPAASFFASFFVTLAVLGSVAAVVVADQNTRHIGWSADETSLAFSSQSQKLDVRLMGNSFVFDVGAIRGALSEYWEKRLVFDRLAPAPERLFTETAELGGCGMLRLYQKYLCRPI